MGLLNQPWAKVWLGACLVASAFHFCDLFGVAQPTSI